MTGSGSDRSFASRLLTATAVLGTMGSLWSCTFDWTLLVPRIEEESGVATPMSPTDVEKSWLDSFDGDVADAHDEAFVDADSDAEAAKPCRLDSPCGAGEFCRFSDHYCGSGVIVGSCAPRPAECSDAGIAPVCGCDHEVYTSQCAAERDGTDVSLQACTTTPPGAYRCGYQFCTSSEYCLIEGSDANTTYECKSLNGCTLGCLCQLLSCVGGSCSTESGHVVHRCP